MKSATYKSISAKKPSKTDREQAVLLGVVELYLRWGKPVGSHTLQENGFGELSSATIRNYLSKMEVLGYLKQPHISGGRLPTEKALRLYAEKNLSNGTLGKEQERAIDEVLKKKTKEIATLIHRFADILSEESRCAVFISSPRFDQDFIQDVKFVLLDPGKLLSVVITDFGLVRTETIYPEREVDLPFLRSCEEYFRWRMNKGEKPLFRTDAEVKAAQRLYNEVMVRHVVGYANFSNEEIIRTGLSKLLSHPELNDVSGLSSSFSLLEDENLMRSILHKAEASSDLMVWIGDELCPFVPPSSECALISIPYRINQSVVGSIALLGPMRLPYRNLFGLIRVFAEKLGRALTQTVYKHQITFRQPTRKESLLENK